MSNSCYPSCMDNINFLATPYANLCAMHSPLTDTLVQSLSKSPCLTLECPLTPLHPTPPPPFLPDTHIAFLFLIAAVRHRCSYSSAQLSPCSVSVHIAGLPAQIHRRMSCCYHRHCHSCSPPPDPKASVIRPYLHRRLFSLKLISLLMFIDVIPW